MQFPINLMLRIETEEEYERFHNGLKVIKEVLKDSDLSTFEALTDRITTRHVDSAKEARVVINGTPIATGTAEEMLVRYRTECGMDERSNITLQEWRDGVYTAIRARKLQRV